MSKNVNTFKKFQFFFDAEKENKQNAEKPNLLKQSTKDYCLKDITPIEMKAYNQLLYLCGQVTANKISYSKNRFRIVKIQGQRIIDEYMPFTDSIIDFDIIDIGETTYLVVLGTDLKSENDETNASAQIDESNQLSGNKDKINIKVVPTKNSIPSVKIFDFSKCVAKTNLEINPAFENAQSQDKVKLLGNLLENPSTFYLMKHKTNKGSFYTGNKPEGLDDNYEPVDGITHFSASQKLNSLAISLSDNTLIQIRPADKENLVNCKEGKYSLIEAKEKGNITNVAHNLINGNVFLYFTTDKNIYYKPFSDNEIKSIGNDNDHVGASEKNFGLGKDGSFIIATPVDYYLEEYLMFDKGRSWFFDKPKKFTQFFNNYIVFVLYDENMSTLCIYDPMNSIFIFYNNTYNKIFNVVHDKERIYLLIEDTVDTRKIQILKEKDNKEKFDTFYKKSFFETAFNYAKNLRYDKKKISEISKLHAEHLYSKGDYEKSIEQYKLTINYLDPSYVIQKFLDGSKLNYLIDYLEELQKNDEFRSKCIPERLKDFTALLLNCYIKQKQIKKLKEFVESKNINDEVTIKTAIEVCKDTNKIDLALSIAQKAKMVESYIQILMDIKGDYAESLDYLKQLDNYRQKFRLLLKYGEKFLEKELDETMKVIKAFVDDIIAIRNGKKEEPKIEESKNPMDKKPIKEMRYERIINIFITKETEPKLEELLDMIMKTDDDCPKQVILRRIELYVDKYSEGKTNSDDIMNKISEILTNKKFEKKLDKNYLLMLFKISGFNPGVTELSKIMELDQDLLQIYMEGHDYPKINSTCEAIMKKSGNKVNYWLQALNYYVSISSSSTRSYLGQYIIQVLDNLSKREGDFSPMILLDILEKARIDPRRVIEFSVIKKYIIDWIQKQKQSLNNDKADTEANFNKIESNNQQLRELQSKAKTYNMPKCPICSQPLEMPFIYFACGHGFHQVCLNAENEETECSVCKLRNSQLSKRIADGKEISGLHNQFFSDLRTNNKKFDYFAKYLGKGIFTNKNDEDSKEVKDGGLGFGY